MPKKPSVDEQDWLVEKVREGALVVVSHSGGKDSMDMLERLVPLVPREQMIVVHAHLVDDDPAKQIVWPGTRERARSHAEFRKVHYIEAVANWSESFRRLGETKSFFGALRRRIELNTEKKRDWPPWPSPDEKRWCTSDLKRGPISTAIGEYQRAKGFTVIIDAEGLRAEESDRRADKDVVKLEEGRSSSKRTWYRYLPIKSVLIEGTFGTIQAAGLRPHWCYELPVCGNERCSCMFCLFGSRNDLTNAALFQPDLFAKYVDLEAKTKPYTLKPGGKPLVEVLGIAPQDARRNRRPMPLILPDGTLAGATGANWKMHRGGQKQIDAPCDEDDDKCWESTNELAMMLPEGTKGTLDIALGKGDDLRPERTTRASFMVSAYRLMLAPEAEDLAASPPRWLPWRELQERVLERQGRWIAVVRGSVRPGAEVRLPGAPGPTGGAVPGGQPPGTPRRFVAHPTHTGCWVVYDSRIGIMLPGICVSAEEAQELANAKERG